MTEPLTEEQIDYMVDLLVKPAIREAIRDTEKLVGAWQSFYAALIDHAEHITNELHPQPV